MVADNKATGVVGRPFTDAWYIDSGAEPDNTGVDRHTLWTGDVAVRGVAIEVVAGHDEGAQGDPSRLSRRRLGRRRVTDGRGRGGRQALGGDQLTTGLVRDCGRAGLGSRGASSAGAVCQDQVEMLFGR